MAKYIVPMRFEIEFECVIEADSREEAKDIAYNTELSEIVDWNIGDNQSSFMVHSYFDEDIDVTEFEITRSKNLQHLSIW